MLDIIFTTLVVWFTWTFGPIAVILCFVALCYLVLLCCDTSKKDDNEKEKRK